MKKVEATGALFYSFETQRYLFLLRNGSKHANTWCFPGGKVDPGETIFEGMMREIVEELGYMPSYRKVIPIEKFTSDNETFEFHTYVFLIDKEFIPILNEEHKGYCWTSLDGWPRPLHPALYKTLKEEVMKEKLRTIMKSF